MESLIRLWKSEDVPHAAKVVFTWLWELIGCEAGTLENMSIHRLAMLCRLSEGQARDRLRGLERCGLVERDETGRGEFTLYVFQPFAPKVERPKKIKPMPLLDYAEKRSEIPSGNPREFPTEKQRENPSGHKSLQTQEITPECVPIPFDDSGGKQEQDKIKEKNKERVFQNSCSEKSVVDTLAEYDIESREFQHHRKRVGDMFREKDISPDLLDRIALGVCLKLPGCSDRELDAIKQEANQLQKDGRISKRYIHVACYMKDVFEAAGYVWVKVRSSRDVRKDRLKRGESVSPPPATATTRNGPTSQPPKTQIVIRVDSNKRTYVSRIGKLPAGVK